jgi:hypothetical protein
LIHLISGCSDFKNEENALQALGRDCGILVDCMPKFHAELAGEGIDEGFLTNLKERLES